jgi:hypothetical protein
MTIAGSTSWELVALSLSRIPRWSTAWWTKLRERRLPASRACIMLQCLDHTMFCNHRNHLYESDPRCQLKHGALGSNYQGRALKQNTIHREPRRQLDVSYLICGILSLSCCYITDCIDLFFLKWSTLAPCFLIALFQQRFLMQ